jgi:multiple sugar transport system substrate-binding protein
MAAGRAGPARHWRMRAVVAGAAGVALASLAGCGGGASGGSGPVTLNYYAPPDQSGASQQVAQNCTKASGGRYRIDYHSLPSAADGQRQQMVRRLAARDPSMDILGMDITWPAEFAEAGWIEPWPADMAAKVKKGTLQTLIDTGTWKGHLYAAPFTTNIQLLWYRTDLVKKPPKTWGQMIDMAERLAKEGKPHFVEIQGAQYEGAVVWFNTLVAGAGGSILTKDSTAPSLGKPALEALQVMKRLATSPASDPSLSNQMEDQNRLAMEAGKAAFELNWPYVYPSMQADKPKANGVELWKHFAWAPYPTIDPNQPPHTTTGGVDLAISHYSPNKQFAFEAAACMRSKDSQRITAVKAGLPPTIESFYTNPSAEFKKTYPFYKAVYKSLQEGVNRPKTPAYQSVSIVISHLVSPPRNIQPQQTLDQMNQQIKDALASKGLVP